MQMTFRWYGEGNDKIKLSDIKQIPGVTGIVWALWEYAANIVNPTSVQHFLGMEEFY